MGELSHRCAFIHLGQVEIEFSEENKQNFKEAGEMVDSLFCTREVFSPGTNALLF